MQAAVRQHLRHAIDAHKRAALAAAKGADLGTCRQCGCDLTARTIGCKRCSDRHYNRLRRQDPEYLEHERQKQRDKRARRRLAKTT